MGGGSGYSCPTRYVAQVQLAQWTFPAGQATGSLSMLGVAELGLLTMSNWSVGDGTTEASEQAKNVCFTPVGKPIALIFGYELLAFIILVSVLMPIRFLMRGLQ